MSTELATKREYGKQRNVRLGVRLTESERVDLEARASELGLSLSEYIRERLIHIQDVTGRVEGPAGGVPDD